MVAPTLAVQETLPADVLAFAAEHGLTPYLEPVLAMTRRVVAGRSLTVYLEEDPEIAGERSVVFEVDVTGWTVEHYVEVRQQWTAEVFDHCPATHVLLFVLSMV